MEGWRPFFANPLHWSGPHAPDQGAMVVLPSHGAMALVIVEAL